MPDTAASSMVVNHEFIAHPWWARCKACGLSMAAHRGVRSSTLDAEITALRCLPWRCDVCVRLDRVVVDLATGVNVLEHFKCTHGGTHAQPSE